MRECLRELSQGFRTRTGFLIHASDQPVMAWLFFGEDLVPVGFRSELLQHKPEIAERLAPCPIITKIPHRTGWRQRKPGARWVGRLLPLANRPESPGVGGGPCHKTRRLRVNASRRSPQSRPQGVLPENRAAGLSLGGAAARRFQAGKTSGQQAQQRNMQRKA